MRYWLPLRERIKKRPVSLVYSVLMGFNQMWSSLFRVDGGGYLMVAAVGVGRLVWLRLVERTPCWDCVRWPLMVSSLDEKYLEALA